MCEYWAYKVLGFYVSGKENILNMEWIDARDAHSTHSEGIQSVELSCKLSSYVYEIC